MSAWPPFDVADSAPLVVKFLLINPNTSERTTLEMLNIARDSGPADISVDAATAAFGVPLICDADALCVAADAVVDLVRREAPPGRYFGILVAAFGDPAVAQVRQILSCPVIGLAEASMRMAAVHGRRFSIVTTTPGLEHAIRQAAKSAGCADQLISIRYTASDATTLASAPARLRLELTEATEAAIAEDGAEAVIIGGGPLAVAAREIGRTVSKPVIEPLPAAMAHLWDSYLRSITSPPI